jgi:hypothetical protein
MLNVKERLPDRATFKFLFHFPEVIRGETVPDDGSPVSWQRQSTGFWQVLRGSEYEVA